MNLWESLRMAVLAIRTSVLRSFLTALGIIIGVATVIIVVALGQGARAAVTQRVESLGTNLVIAFPSPGSGVRFTAGLAASLAQRVPDVTAAMPVFSGRGAAIVWHTQNTQASLQGVSPRWLAMRGAHLAAGSFITRQQVTGRSRVAVVGQTVLTNLGMPPAAAVGRQIFVGGTAFTVEGVLQPLGAGVGGQSQDSIVLMPYTTSQDILHTAYPSELYFQVAQARDAALVVGTLDMIFAHDYPRPNAVNVASQDQLLSTLSSVNRTLTLTLGSVAAVSLLVGGIGIMNIMLVSVVERTREIGLRKAIGARRRDVLGQFLIEAVLLSGGGGLIGVAFGAVATHIGGVLLKIPMSVSPVSAAVGLLFALVVGVVFGMWPAAQASRLDPIAALRRD